MATASRRRRTARTASSSSSSSSTPNHILGGAVAKHPPPRSKQHLAPRRHGVRSDDPRLKLSMRAFHPVLDKTRRPRLSFNVLSSLSQPSQSSQSSHSSQASQASQSSQPTAPPPRPTTYLAFPPGLHRFVDLYDPRSPWGVTGIKYDPCSPRPANSVAPSLDHADSSPPSSPSPPPPERHPERHALPFYLASSSADTQEAANHGLATDIVKMLATKRLDGDAADKDKMAAAADFSNMRFALASGSGLQAQASAAQAPLEHDGMPPRQSLPASRPAKATPKKAQPAKKTPVPVPAASRCCPPEVPSIVHMVLDGNVSDMAKTKSNLCMLQQQFADTLHLLCSGHREKYLRMETSPLPLAPLPLPPQTAPTALPASAPSAPWAFHASPARPPPTLQPKPDAFPTVPRPAAPAAAAPAQAPAHAAPRPLPRPARDDVYRHEMLREIADRFHPLGETEEFTHGDVTNRIVYNLLSVAVHPQPVVNGRGDAHFLSGEEAYALLDRCSPREPVVTQNEQTFRWRPRMRPIEELFRRMENLDRKVSVQVPSRRCTDDSFESCDLVDVRGRFLRPAAAAAATDDDPWNILDLRSPLPAAVLPQFLTSENCQLLPRLRDEVLNPSRAERDTASREQWNEWRDVLEWVLLSEGGHNTSPHTDSHGLATWITVQEGLFGFGWMSHPTPAERQQWTDDPHGFTGGRWCFMLLEPGQTVFFNSGTVHFVFRQRGQATLALGGHILQWSGIARWLEIVAAQMKNPHITNEDMEWSAPKYVRVVARLVAMRLQQRSHDGGGDDKSGQHSAEVSRIEAMGGEAAVKGLLQLLKDFDDEYLRPRPKGKAKKKRR